MRYRLTNIFFALAYVICTYTTNTWSEDVAKASNSDNVKGGSVAKFRLISRSVFMPSPADGVASFAQAFYTSPTTTDMISFQSLQQRADTGEYAYIRFSSDNGKRWAEPIKYPLASKEANGMRRIHLKGGWCDSRNGNFLSFRIVGVLPTDHPVEGQKAFQIFYTVSTDGGKTQLINEQIIHEGKEYSPAHPLPGVWLGKNCYMIGDVTCAPLQGPDGTVLLPIQISQLNEAGELLRKDFTFQYSAVLIGRWQKDNRLSWTLSTPVYSDPEKTSRGVFEPTLAYLSDGRILMVMRGSNDRLPSLPSHRWFSITSDHGMTWQKPAPWTDTSGEAFFSPSSCSQLVSHSSGRLFWIGNITPKNPQGNAPRYPLCISEVDRTSGMLIKASTLAFDDRLPTEHKDLTISNFYAHEDRESQQVRIYVPRLFAKHGQSNWTGDTFEYRIAVE